MKEPQRTSLKSVFIEKVDDTNNLTQPNLVDNILYDLNVLMKGATTKITPASLSAILKIHSKYEKL